MKDTLYTSIPWNRRDANLKDTSFFICDGGLRYKDSKGKEQSAWNGGYYGTTKTIDWTQIVEGFRDYFADLEKAGIPYMLNVEHASWDLFQLDHVAQVGRNLETLHRALKTPVWFYPMPPGRSTGMMEGYLRWRDATKTWSFARLLAEVQRLSWNSPPRQFQRWQKANEIGASLVLTTGVATPSVYRTYRKMHTDNLYEHVREATRIYGIENPLYPVVCPLYTNNQDPTINGQPIPLEDFREDVRNIRRGGADGLLIWSPDAKKHVTQEHIDICRDFFPKPKH